MVKPPCCFDVAESIHIVFVFEAALAIQRAVSVVVSASRSFAGHHESPWRCLSGTWALALGMGNVAPGLMGGVDQINA